MITPSHRFSRLLAVDKLSAPRDFYVPDVLSLAERPSLALEIGAGRGKHAALFAGAHPDCHLLAIERTCAKVRDLLAHGQIYDNLDAIHADAIAWTVHALPVACLDTVFILYPNPEPNNANQRWVNMPYFEFLLSRMAVGARLVLASNINSYIEEAQRKLDDIWQLPVTQRRVPSDSMRTHFEIKYLQRGEPCWQLDVIKPDGYVTRFDEYSPKLVDNASAAS